MVCKYDDDSTYACVKLIVYICLKFFHGVNRGKDDETRCFNVTEQPFLLQHLQRTVLMVDWIIIVLLLENLPAAKLLILTTSNTPVLAMNNNSPVQPIGV